jgi:hypothetical protein
MICQTNKDIVFCIFIPKLTEKITEKYPIVIFNPNKKLRSPLQNKVVNGVRPSMLDASNTLVLGKQ